MNPAPLKRRDCGNMLNSSVTGDLTLKPSDAYKERGGVNPAPSKRGEVNPAPQKRGWVNPVPLKWQNLINKEYVTDGIYLF